MKYIIHACPDRMWYVKDFLVPSMLEQGIPIDDITVQEDVDKMGTLKFYLKCFMELPKDNYGTWHLQDDVVISKYFKERTQQYDDGLVNGFCSRYCEGKGPGIVGPKEMWYSFPCMRIPNALVHNFIKWYYQKAVNEPKYQYMVEANKFIDAFFMYFIQTMYPDIRLRNLSPNLVDHIDYMLGGSTINSAKITLDRRSKFWNEEDVIKELEYKLQQRDKR